MKIECAWCGKDQGEKEGPEEHVTHGICEVCADKLLKQDQEEFGEKGDVKNG